VNVSNSSLLQTLVSGNETPSDAGPVPGAGTLINGAYRVIGPLGEGSMGVVLLAEDQSLDRHVAVKFLRQNLLDQRFRERFAAEARAMARVSHPNVVQIHALGEHGGVPFFVMEFVEGQNLEQWLIRHGRPPTPDLALRILDGMCDGVAAIHAAGTVHRDLKPTNILLDAELRPRIADLGLAVLWRQAQTSKRELVGTPAYMAPEIVFADRFDPAHRSRADVYSLGCIAYELVTGESPFASGGAAAETLLQHMTEEVRVPSSVCACSSPELDHAILRALTKDPANRTPTVDALRRDLAAARRSLREPIRILVADDDADFMDLVAIELERGFPGAEVECVADGQKAIDAFDRSHPSVMLIDLRMPGLDGFQLTEFVRKKRDPSSSIPIIVLTGSAGPNERNRLSALGADRLLTKPVVANDIVATVRDCLLERATRAARPC
jgi:serine/threonine protein kinase